MSTSNGTSQLGTLIRTTREDKGLTQEELAEMAGISQRGLSDIERGETLSPRPKAVSALANALGLDIADVYVAMGRARTKEDGRRVAEATPTYDDPTITQVLTAARRLTPAARLALVRHMETFAELEAQIEEDLRRDGQ